jgi:hypothetical protein
VSFPAPSRPPVAWSALILLGVLASLVLAPISSYKLACGLSRGTSPRFKRLKLSGIAPM